jgi:hypothetical protein
VSAGRRRRPPSRGHRASRSPWRPAATNWPAAASGAPGLREPPHPRPRCRIERTAPGRASDRRRPLRPGQSPPPSRRWSRPRSRHLPPASRPCWQSAMRGAPTPPRGRRPHCDPRRRKPGRRRRPSRGRHPRRHAGSPGTPVRVPSHHRSCPTGCIASLQRRRCAPAVDSWCAPGQQPGIRLRE